MVKTKKTYQKRNSRLNTNSSINLLEESLKKTLTTKTSLTLKNKTERKKKINKKYSQTKICSHSNIKKYVSFKQEGKKVKYESFKELSVYENLHKFEYLNKEKPDMDFDFDSDEELIKSAINDAQKNLLKSLERETSSNYFN